MRAHLAARATLALDAVIAGIVEHLTAGGDEVATVWARLEADPSLTVTDVAIAGIRCAGRALQYVLDEYGSDEAARMVRVIGLYSELDLAAVRRDLIRLEQGEDK